MMIMNICNMVVCLSALSVIQYFNAACAYFVQMIMEFIWYNAIDAFAFHMYCHLN